jgi:hypothetical protein
LVVGFLFGSVPDLDEHGLIGLVSGLANEDSQKKEKPVDFSTGIPLYNLNGEDGKDGIGFFSNPIKGR